VSNVNRFFSRRAVFQLTFCQATFGDEAAALVLPKLEDSEEETGSLASRESMLNNVQHFNADDLACV